MKYRDATPILLCTFAALLAACTARYDVRSPGFTAVIQGPSSSVVANGTDAATIGIVLRDYQGRPAPNTTISVVAKSAGVVVEEPTPTNAQGSTTARLTSTSSGDVTLNFSVVVAGKSLSLPNELTVTFVAPRPQSSLVANPNALIADGVTQSTITLTLDDPNGNPIAGQAVTFSSNDPNGFFSVTQSTTAPNGTATVSYASTRAGVDIVTASYAGLTLDAEVSFQAGPVAFARSQLIASPNNLLANGTSQALVTLTLADALGNPVSGQAVTFSCADPNGLFSDTKGMTSGAGSVAVSFASTRVGTDTVIASFSGQSLATSIDLVVGPTADVILTATPNSLVANNATTSEVVIAVTDAQHHPIPSAQVTYAASGGNNTLSPASPGVAGSDGTFTFTLKSKTAQIKSVTASANSINAAPVNITFVAGPPLPANSSFTATPSTIVANATSTSSLSVSLRDAFGNPCANASITFTSSDGIASFSSVSPRTNAAGQASGNVSSTHAIVNHLGVSSQGITLNADLTFTAGSPNATQSTLTASPNILTANGVDSAVITERVVDAFGNPVANQNVVITTNGTGNIVGALQGMTDASGRFATTLKSTIAGIKLLRASVSAGFTDTGTVQFTSTLTPACTSLPGLPGPPASNANGLVIQNLIADLDGDSNNDVLSVVQGNQLVTALGRGNGSLATSIITNLGAFAANGLVMADFNGDGQQDVVMSSSSTSTIALYLGSPGGNLSAHGTQAVCANAVGIAAADFTGDNKQDIAVACGNANTIGVYANNGAAQFTNAFSTSLPDVPSAIAAAFMDSGTSPDLVVTSANANQVYVLINSGVSFTAQPALSVNGSPSGLAIADFNGDTFNDVVTMNANSTSFAFLQGTNTGALGAPTYVVLMATPSSIVAADFNHDSKADVGVTGATLATDSAMGIDIMLGNGSGGFAPPVHTSVNAQSFSLAAGKLNTDSYTDVVVSTLGPVAQPLMGVGNGNFLIPSATNTGTALSVSAVGDFNNDGNVDLVTTDLFGDSYATYLGNGDGTLRTPLVGASDSGQAFLTAADYTSDGNLDIIVSGSHLYGYTGVGDGTFVNQTDMCPGCTAFGSVQVGNLNHDAYSDYIVWANSNLLVYMGAAGTMFTNTLTLSPGVSSADVHFFIDDFNADGNNDVVWLNSSTGIMFYAGQGDGTFAAAVTHAFAFLNGGYKGDFNGDGYPDLAVEDNNYTLYVMLNDTTGRFVLHNTYPDIRWGIDGREGDVGDLNGDSYLDILISGWRPNAGVIILLGDGAGGFGPPLSYIGAKDVQFSYAADVNNDGHTDVIGNAYDGEVINVFLYTSCY